MQEGRFDSGGRRALACSIGMTIARAGLAVLAVSVFACTPAKRAETPPSTPAASADPARPLPSPLPQVVARVNGRPIALAQILPFAKLALDHVAAGDRERSKPEVLRKTLDSYVERELLLQEALARGIRADSRAVDWAYDQARRGQPDEAAWRAYLAKQGATPESFRAELRIQQTIVALIQEEVRSAPLAEAELRAAYDADPGAFSPPGAKTPAGFEAVRGEVETAVRQAKQGPIAAALVARLRAQARIELLL